MNSAITPSTPQKKKHLSRDEKLQIYTLHKAGLCQEKIAKQLQVTKRQVQYTIRNHLTSPKKRSGRPSALNEEQVDELVLFVTSSSATRRMTYLDFSHIAFPNWNVSERVIKGALNRRGYERRIARPKPALTEERKQARLDFAERYCSWTLEQWSKILWTDETWVTGSFHSGTWITRKVRIEISYLYSAFTKINSVMKHTPMTVSCHLHHERAAGCSGDLFRGMKKGHSFSGKKNGGLSQLESTVRE